MSQWRETEFLLEEIKARTKSVSKSSLSKFVFSATFLPPKEKDAIFDYNEPKKAE
jgi:hypothetical protein